MSRLSDGQLRMVSALIARIKAILKLSRVVAESRDNNTYWRLLNAKELWRLTKLDSEIRGLQSQLNDVLEFPTLVEPKRDYLDVWFERHGFTEMRREQVGLFTDFGDSAWRDRLVQHWHSLQVIARLARPPVARNVRKSADSRQANVLEPAMRATPGQLKILGILERAGHRMTLGEILTESTKHGKRMSDGYTKQALAEMKRRGVIDNRQDVRPRGYAVVKPAL